MTTASPLACLVCGTPMDVAAAPELCVCRNCCAALDTVTRSSGQIDDSLVSRFAASFGFGGLSTFHLFLPAPGWIVRWYFDASLQRGAMHLRIERPMLIVLKAQADRLVAILELDQGGSLPIGGAKQ